MNGCIKSIWQILKPMYDKKFQRTRIRGEYPQLDKEYKQKTSTSIILNGNIPNDFLLTLGVKYEYLPTTATQHHSRRSSQCNKARKQNKGHIFFHLVNQPQYVFPGPWDL